MTFNTIEPIEFIHFYKGLDVSMRDKVAENMKNKDQLTPCQNSGVIHSLNYHVLKQFGRRRPNPDLCRLLNSYFMLAVGFEYK